MTRRSQRALFFSKFEELDRGTVFDDKCNPHTIRRRVRRNNDFLPFNFRRQIIYLEGNVRHGADEVRNGCLRLEAHPFDSVCAGFIPRYVRRVPFNESLTFTAVGGRDSDVVVSAHRSVFYRSRLLPDYIWREILEHSELGHTREIRTNETIMRSSTSQPEPPG